MTPKPLNPTYAWAVVNKTGKLCVSSYRGQKAIWTEEVDALMDCPPYGSVVRVSITEVEPKKLKGRKVK